jgi:hypothetical protein
VLDENGDVLPFFKARHDLALLITSYIPHIKNAHLFAHEFPIYGDFKADLIVGDSSTQSYLRVDATGRVLGVFYGT